MKRKLGHHSDSDENMFDITGYNLINLDNLIEMIKDYSEKKLPSRRFRRFYPSKMDVLPNILPLGSILYDLNAILDVEIVVGDIPLESEIIFKLFKFNFVVNPEDRLFLLN